MKGILCALSRHLVTDKKLTDVLNKHATLSFNIKLATQKLCFTEASSIGISIRSLYPTTFITRAY